MRSKQKKSMALPFHIVAILPTVLVVFLVGLVPAGQSLLLSLSSFSLRNAPGDFVGLLNYWELIFKDPHYLSALGFTFSFAFVATTCELILGFCVALLLANVQINAKVSAASRTLMMIPFVVAPVVVSYAYKTLIYDGSFGYLNYALRLLNLPEFFVFEGSFNAPIALLIMEVMLRTPFVVLIIYAGIMTINTDVMDAADVDNASGLRKVWHIILPTILPVIVVAYALRFMDALKIYDEVFILTAGGPGYITNNASLFTARVAFEAPFRLGYAAAASFLFTLIVILLTLVAFRFFRMESANIEDKASRPSKVIGPILAALSRLRRTLMPVRQMRDRLPTTQERRRMALKKKMGGLSKYLLLAIYLFLSLAPFILLVLTSIKGTKAAMTMPPTWIFMPTLENYQRLLTNQEFLRSVMNSIIVAFGATAFSTAAGTLTGYAFARFSFAGRSALSFLILIMRMIPPIALVIPYYLLWQWLGLRDTHIALIAMYVALSLPIVVWMMYSFFLDFPREIEEAAIVDGASRWNTFRLIVVPAMYPSILASATLAFLLVWNEFIFAQYNTGRVTRTLPVEIYSKLGVFGFDWGILSASAVIAVVPAVLFFALTQKHLVRGLTMGAVKG